MSGEYVGKQCNEMATKSQYDFKYRNLLKGEIWFECGSEWT